MPHFEICRVEQRKGLPNDDGTVYPVGHIQAHDQQQAEMILSELPIRIRGQERLILVPCISYDAVRQAKAIERERRRADHDCRNFLQFVMHFSLDN